MATGHITQIIGTVIDVEFPPDQLPDIYNAIEVERDGTPLVAEVQQHLGNNWVRALAMDTTDGLRRGTLAVDTGKAISVPVGEKTLGRLFNVLGEPLDSLGDIQAEHWPIHRQPPSFEEQETQAQVLETGIKVIDL